MVLGKAEVPWRLRGILEEDWRLGVLLFSLLVVSCHLLEGCYCTETIAYCQVPG
ncbi:unnamed protein product [Ilex paraguariensis]|uniref:Uncharacterized protein n=1 Tax=Ilex paraguariensis TaxID=185542 RepID=A0ABC8UQK3_9AQUA